MSVLIKHNKVSTIPDTDDTSLVRPSDWNADHVVVGAAESGANSDITSLTGITGGISTPDYVQFDTTAAESSAVGKLFWDDGDGVLSNGLKGGNVTLQIGTQEFARVYNDSGTTLTKGQVVYISGAQGNRVAVKLARANVEATSFGTIGLVAETMTSGAEGFIIVSGALYKLDTLGLTAGATVYVSPTTAGALTTTKPQAPDQLVVVGWVERVNATVGSIYVKVDNGYEMDELHDVQINGPTTGQTLVYNGTTSVWQNSNAPTISGGTINNTTIGATTPSTVNATTITGQTARVNGTGSNILLQSNVFTNAAWTASAVTIATTVATTDPFGGTSAYIVTENSATATHSYLQNASISANTFVFSGYFKNASGTRWIMLSFNNATSFCHFQPSTGDIGASSNATGTSVAVGNGWYRFQIVFTAVASNNVPFEFRFKQTGSGASTYTGDGTSGFYIYGAQLEAGNSVGTYTNTTTTAVYGTPTLSFSGVSEIGLLSNGALYLQPAGTGALQAQATTSTTAGGNARGGRAVDWQTERATAAQVASGLNSFVGGGYANYSNNYCGVTAGGYANGSSYLNSVGGGQGNFSTAQWAAISGGNANTGSGYGAFIGGGSTNTAAGYFNVIGGGFTNAGTALAAVTTQSGTMNGTTAVTLSGSNANIKVGQYITGTSIAGDTYVAAISGTSLTLSKVASGSSTSTLSFFTPHGVVVGGGNNQATGSYSFIGGGGDAGTSGNRNVASGDWSFVGGGRNNTASGNGSVICGGGTDGSNAFSNTATTTICTVGGGFLNNATAYGGVIIGGGQNTANGIYSNILGGTQGTSRGITGYTVFSASNTPIANASGVSQSALLVLAVQTTDATATALRSNTSAAGTTNQVILPNNSAYLFKATVISGVTGGGNTSGWKLEGVIKRGANAASTVIVGTVTTTLLAQDAGASGWVIAATADTTNGGLRITFTGQASTTIRTVCKVETTEVTF
jgi:hypothetical protein